MTDRHLIRILIAGFVLLALGEAYLIINTTSHNVVAGQAVGSSQSQSSATSPTPSAPTTVVADKLQPVSGSIAAVGSNSFTLTQSTTGSSSAPISVIVSSGTQIISQGALLDQATQDANMAAFHAYSEQLMQDPVKNQQALSELIAPSPYQTTILSPSDLKAGDVVSILGMMQPDGSFAAVQVIVNQQ